MLSEIDHKARHLLDCWTRHCLHRQGTGNFLLCLVSKANPFLQAERGVVTKNQEVEIVGMGAKNLKTTVTGIGTSL